ncbi:hypothetical protein E3N88_26955 [Mikania micrantha]|uniref:Thaumatin-like protein n=1 Tax=Mikania micrantha TaxID=192012 RepID=A0A5N6MWV5_9ASTR|nr:hypothetical protein E3N88_26955 [Mikania micrantha]
MPPSSSPSNPHYQPPPPPPPPPPNPRTSTLLRSYKKGKQTKVFRVVRTVFRSFTIVKHATGRFPLPGSRVTDGHRTNCVTGTLYGYHEGRVSLVIQENPKTLPIMILELELTTDVLQNEMGLGMVRITLECEKHLDKDKDKVKLLDEPFWTMFFNECQSYGAPPNTLAEFALNQDNNNDFVDISLVDGFNVPMEFSPVGASCKTMRCGVDLNGPCPEPLRTQGGCNNPCTVFKTVEYCCTIERGSCGPTEYSRFFKDRCPDAYSYPQDDQTSLFTCPGGTNYKVVFCP